jgi:hypothetical protein
MIQYEKKGSFVCFWQLVECLTKYFVAYVLIGRSDRIHKYRVELSCEQGLWQLSQIQFQKVCSQMRSLVFQIVLCLFWVFENKSRQYSPNYFLMHYSNLLFE